MSAAVRTCLWFDGVAEEAVALPMGMVQIDIATLEAAYHDQQEEETR